MTRRVYLFADTNLFIQCRPLEELDWSPWPEFSEVHLIVSRPVRREIDGQKNRGNDRVGRRSRAAHGLFREIILGGRDHLPIRTAKPQVKLFLDEGASPSAAWAERLDYSMPDDAIIGHMCAFIEQQPGVDVRLLTHDSGPMMTARSLDLPFVPIPDSWILEPETSEMEKENRHLKETITRLQEGPAFQIEFVDGNRRRIDEINAEHQVYAPLSSEELADLMRWLAASTRPKISYGLGVSAEAYQEWVDECEQILAALHYEMQVESGGVPFSIVIANDGTRPAKDALVEITAMGNLQIRPHEENSAEFYAVTQEGKMALPPKPRPLLDVVYAGMATNLSGSEHNERRDPNGFYYKPELPEGPGASYCLECAQWRHGAGDGYFDGQIFVLHGDGEVRGLLQCVIHADNLAEPVRAEVPVRIRANVASAMDRASALVSDFIQAK